MAKLNDGQNPARTFAGIVIPPELKTYHYYNLYFASLLVACLITLPAVVQPAFLKDVINIPKEQSGSINSGLQNMGQIAWLLFTGAAGILSDKVGRRRLVIAGFLISGIFYVLFGYTKDICLLMGVEGLGGQIVATYVIRFLIGIGIILTFPQIGTMCADYSYPPDRGKAMAYQGITISIGSMIVFGGLTQVAKSAGLMTLFYIAGAFCFIGMLISYFGLVDRMPKEKASKISMKELYKIVTKSIPLKVSYVVTIVLRVDILIIATYIIVWMVYAADKMGMNPVKATASGGIMLLTMSVVTLFAWPPIGILLDKWGRTPVILLSIASTSLGYFLIAATENPFSLPMYFYLSLIGIGFSAATTGATALAADASPKHLLGSIMGGMNALQSIGTLVFLQAGGIMLDEFGYWSPFLMKGIVNTACGIWVLKVRKGINIPAEKEI